VQRIGLSLDEVKRCLVRAAEAAFLPEDDRRALVERFRTLLDVPQTSH
jgi:hypothetical protein